MDFHQGYYDDDISKYSMSEFEDILPSENIQHQIENAGAMDQDGQCKEFRGLGGNIVEEIEKIPEARALYERIRQRTIQMIYLGITNKSNARKDHIPMLIKRGVEICVAVMKNKQRAEGGFDMFKRVIINAQIVLEEISARNNKLGDQKFTVFQLFGHFLACLRDELVEIFLNCNIARYVKRKFAKPPTFGVTNLLVLIFICYVIQQTGIFNSTQAD